MRTISKNKILKAGLLGVFISINLFILAESLVPAGQSTETSMSWTNFFASVAEFFGSDKAKIVEPESVEISGFETIVIGESKRLTASVFPETTTDKSVEWESSNEMIAEVTSGGIVVAKTLGDIRITAISSKDTVSSFLDISVVDYPAPESFSLATEKAEIYIGTTTVIDVSNLLPEKASKKLLTWESFPSSVASVNSSGVVKGLSNGVASIQATSGSFSASIDISVTTSPTLVVPPTMIDIVGDTTGYVYRHTQLASNFGEFPPTDTSVTWLSSDENIAKVDKTGNVYGTKFEGNVTITAISNVDETIFATIDMTIEPVFPISFTISANSLSVIAGNTINLTPTFDPIDVTNKEIIWSSSNESIATVSSKGDFAQVLGLKSGTVTIFGVSKMDEMVQSQINLEILKAAVMTPGDRALLNNFIRKALGHFALFFLDGIITLAVFIFLTSLPIFKKIISSLGIGTFIASLSEALQLITEGRSGKAMDVLLDCFGFFCAVLISFIIFKVIKQRKESKNKTAAPKRI